MSSALQPPRAALYVDFDNVFMALLRWDERAAYAFGERPDAWLASLERDPEAGASRRRILIRRCYLNPGRYVDFPLSGPVAAYRATLERRNRLYFSEFRANFVQAGFDVVDCPPVASLKNAADMKMALDIREALDHPTRFDEFVLLSGDSDFLPALTRLRAHDRRITILAQDTAKQAYLAAADEVVGLNDFANSGLGALPIAAFDVTPPGRERVAAWPRPEAPPPAPPRLAEPPRDPADLRDAAIAWLRDFLARIPAGTVLMTTAGDGLRRAFPNLKDTNYAGAGTLGRLIEDAADPRLAIHGPSHQRWLYDPARHTPPAAPASGEAAEPGDAAPTGAPAASGAAAAQQTAGIGDNAATAGPEPSHWAAPLPQPAAAPEEAYAALGEPAAPDWPPPAAVEPPPSAPPQTPPRPMDRAEREAFIAETVAKVRDLLWGRRDIKGFAFDLPAFATAELGFVLTAIARRSPFGPMQLERTARDVAAEAAAQGVLVSQREVVAVIRWLLRGKVSFRDQMTPMAAMSLAEALYDQVGRALERAMGQRMTAPRPEERMDEDEWAALEAWCLGGLSVA